MYLETSGDLNFTVLIEGIQASSNLAKVGIMFRSSVSPNSSHYSLFHTKGNETAQQHRPCTGCNTTHYGTQQSYSSVWLRVVKAGNVFKALYKPSYLAKSAPWYPFGNLLTLNAIPSNIFFVGVALSSNTGVATSHISNIQLTRTCSSKTITQLQCN
jgi:hypothetical protein